MHGIICHTTYFNLISSFILKFFNAPMFKHDSFVTTIKTVFDRERGYSAMRTRAWVHGTCVKLDTAAASTSPVP